MANGEERDPAYDYTEDVIKKLERRLKTEYERAGRSAKRKLEEFMQEFEKKDAEKQREMSYGLIDEDEYNAWRQRQILQAGNYQQMVDVLASDFTHADEQARQIMAGEMPAIYAENFNFATWEAEGYGSIDTSFTLYNRAAVAELALHDADLLPLPSPKRLAELAASDQLWNRQLVSSSMMQSILAGESVPKMATRLATSVGEKNYHSAVRAVRTMSTAVQNKSRIDAFERAKANGSDIQSQIWLAVMDNRTRHAHRQLDHQEVPVGEPFKVDGYELRFPADPEAPAYLKYNCRCSVRGRIKGLEMLADKTLDYSKLGGQSYEEWRAGKAKGESQKRIEEGEARARMAKEPQYRTVEKAGAAVSLMRSLGFDMDGIPKGIEPELFVDLANRLSQLSAKYPIMGDGRMLFRVTDLGTETVASVGAKESGVDTSLSVNIRFYGRKKGLISSEKKAEKRGWTMPSDDDKKHVYSITHEYGHIIQDHIIFTPAYRSGYSKCTSKSERTAFFKLNYVQETEKQRREIISIAKEMDPDFDIGSSISKYGQSDPTEFFAEVFANSQCGKPNTLGKAMIEFLKRRGIS